MLRSGSLEEISDGRLYRENDMVRVDCQGCVGCSRCCRDMVDTIYLTPLDVCRITSVTGKDFTRLLQGELKLVVLDGIILPNLQAINGHCPFLSETGRCTIHGNRPDLCRLFPLGRYYEENGDFSYFIQIHECDHSKIKTKVKKWIDCPDYSKYREFIISWHGLTKQLSSYVADLEDHGKLVLMDFVQEFYAKGFEEASFYEVFQERKKMFLSKYF